MVPEPLITVSESGERAVANINELRGYVESAARNENGAGTAEIRSGLRLLKASVDNNICMLRKAGRGENRKVISALASVSGAIDEQLFKMRAEGCLLGRGEGKTSGDACSLPRGVRAARSLRGKRLEQPRVLREALGQQVGERERLPR